MCDTVVATAGATADGVTILGKNSDRDPNEAITCSACLPQIILRAAAFGVPTSLGIGSIARPGC
jgi:hypothetical protein